MQREIYEAVIGLEVHIQLSTKSKAFCADRASFSTIPNSQVSIISLAHHGTLPKIISSQVTSAIKLGLALGCDINQKTYFDRKHYFYADLPKGFQTTQDSMPICVGGLVDFLLDKEIRTCRVHHIHMEEDAGKSLHEEGESYSLIDLNRAGVPLLELVTEPDLRSADEVFEFIHALRKMVRFLDISDGNMEEGSLRCDCNVSVRRKGESILNPRSEIKNVNSARFAKRAVNFEIDRQIKLLQQGEKTIQETREFIPESGITRPLRGKEEAHDYRYFPEPDLPPVIISKEEIFEIRKTIPSLPIQCYKILMGKYKLPHTDAIVISDHLDYFEYFEYLIRQIPSIHPQKIAKLFINRIKPYLEENEYSSNEFPLKINHLSDFLNLVEEGTIAKSIIYQKIWPVLLSQPQDVKNLLTKSGLDRSSSNEDLKNAVLEIIAQNQPQVQKYRRGKKNVIGFFMGQVMRKTGGKANPDIAREFLLEELER